MTKKRCTIKPKTLPDVQKGRHATAQQRGANFSLGRIPFDEGFFLSMTVSTSTMRYLSRFFGALIVLAACWYAPDAAVLAGKLKAVWEVAKLFR